MHEDVILIKQFLEEGDEKALQTLVKNYLKPIYSYVFYLCKDKDASEDISQEVFLKVWKNLEKYDQSKSFKTWIFTIAHRTTIDYFRKRKNLAFSDFDTDEGNIIIDTLQDKEILQDEYLMREEEKEHINSIISLLPPKYKEIIVLKYIEEMTFNEIANILKQSINTVTSKHRRAIILLQKLMDAQKYDK